MKNKVYSYLVSVFKGHQNRREIPKEISKSIVRELKFIAYDRNFTESVMEIDPERKSGMSEAADDLNKER